MARYFSIFIFKTSESISVFKKSLLQFSRPSGSEVYNIHDSIGLKYFTRLRLEFSHLREHKFRHNFHDIINPLCSCNVLESEFVNHFFLLCPIYASQRKILLDSIFELDAGVENLSNSKLAELLLYSKNLNASILKLTIYYLMNTERFDCPLL